MKEPLMINFLKKISVLFFAVLAVGIANISSLRAQGDCNCQTAENTKGILATINTFPKIYGDILAKLIKLTIADNGDEKDESGNPVESPTTQLTEKFSKYDSAIMDMTKSKSADEEKYTAMKQFEDTAFADANPDAGKDPSGQPIIDPKTGQPKIVDYTGINKDELSYSKVIQKSEKKDDPQREKQVLSYIKTVAGLNLFHKTQGDFRGGKQEAEAYKRFVNTMLAAETYNSYMLAQMYTKYKNQDKDNFLGEEQIKLIEQAKDSDWLVKVRAEPISFVIRQLLLYTSQLLVVQFEMIQIQQKNHQEMMISQGVTNTLLMLIGQYSENQMLRSATG